MPRCQSDRRRFLQQMALGSAAYTVPGVFAEQLELTPRQTEGPFYPDRLPLDTDNDLLLLNDVITPAVGEVTHLSGKVLTPQGNPVRNAVVEIWQVDSQGAYLHTQSGNRQQRDVHFQGFGRFLTGAKGDYYFRTIKPVAYGPRTPHIHLAIQRGAKRILTTQCYVRGHAGNKQDPVLRSLRGNPARELLMVDFRPLPDSKIGELVAEFNVVIGETPQDREPVPGPARGSNAFRS